MDVITTAVVTALANLSEKVISDAYGALKAALTQKFGADSDLATAVDGLEKRPDSSGRRETLREEVATAKADQDQELVQLANVLLERLSAQQRGQQVIQQTVTGHQNVFSGTGNVTAHIGPKTK